MKDACLVKSMHILFYKNNLRQEGLNIAHPHMKVDEKDYTLEFFLTADYKVEILIKYHYLNFNMPKM